MGNIPRTIVTRTLGDLSAEQRLWANCEHCGHSHKLDLDDLRTKYGTRMPIRRLGRMLRCRRCQQRAAGSGQRAAGSGQRAAKVMLTYTNGE